MRHAAVAGHDWSYLAGGASGPGLLILPGAIGLGEMSFQHMLRLEESYCVVAPDYPEGIGLAALVDGLAGLLDAEGIERAHVLGGSYGGMVAQCVVRRYPERVRSLILSHTGAPRPERAAGNRRFLLILRLLPMPVLRWLLRQVTRRSLRDAPDAAVFWNVYSDEMVLRLSKANLLDRYRMAVEFDETARWSPGDLSGWPGRILILEGDNDPIAEERSRAELHALYPDAQVHTFHGSGHVASIARPDEYLAVVRAFLSAQDPLE